LSLRSRIPALVSLATYVLNAPFLLAAEQNVVRLGFVAPGSPSTTSIGFAAFWNRLHELGWVEGQNLVVERRWAARHDKLPELMREVVASKVDIIVMFGTPGGIAAKQSHGHRPDRGCRNG